MKTGFAFTGIVFVTVFVVVSITEILLELKLVTYRFVPVATECEGDDPTGTVAIMLLVLVSITETFAELEFNTYRLVPTNVECCGLDPTGITAHDAV